MYTEYLIYKLATIDPELQPYLNKRVKRLVHKMDYEAQKHAKKYGHKLAPLNIKVTDDVSKILGPAPEWLKPAFEQQFLRSKALTSQNGIFIHPDMLKALKEGKLGKTAFNYIIGHEIGHNLDRNMVTEGLAGKDKRRAREIFADVYGNYLAGGGKRAKGPKGFKKAIGDIYRVPVELVENRHGPSHPSINARIKFTQDIKPETALLSGGNIPSVRKDVVDKFLGGHLFKYIKGIRHAKKHPEIYNMIGRDNQQLVDAARDKLGKISYKAARSLTKNQRIAKWVGLGLLGTGGTVYGLYHHFKKNKHKRK